MKNKVSIFLLFFVFLIFSCKSQTEEKVINEKISVKTGTDNVSEIKVILEGKDGNCVDGAFVAIKSSENDYSVIDYDGTQHCYYSNIEIVTENEILFVIDSVLLPERNEVSVPYTKLSEKPVITVFSDEEGNSILKGQHVKSSSELQLSWNYPIEDCVYKVSISSSAEVVYAVSTKSMTVYIPEGTLQPNKIYFAKIQVQKSSGDITFEKEGYYSVCVKDSENIQFSTN